MKLPGKGIFIWLAIGFAIGYYYQYNRYMQTGTVGSTPGNVG